MTFIVFSLPEVLEANGDYKPVVEVTRESASFSVANLRPATAYRLLITATNAKGKSRSAELRAYTVALNHPQHETPAGKETPCESEAESTQKKNGTNQLENKYGDINIFYTVGLVFRWISDH